MKYNQLTILHHPIIQRDLTLLRDKNTPSNSFRAVLRRIAIMMAFEVTKGLKSEAKKVSTPLEKADGTVIKNDIILVPVLRAGLGMVGGFVEVLPDAKVGHIGLYRNEKTLQPVDYYFKVPRNLSKADVYLLDPMLATGGSAAAAISFLKRKGAKRISMVSIVSAPEGVKNLRKNHPDVKVYTCAVDRKLNQRGYILPGLGDAGDRIFGTED